MKQSPRPDDCAMRFGDDVNLADTLMSNTTRNASACANAEQSRETTNGPTHDPYAHTGVGSPLRVARRATPATPVHRRAALAILLNARCRDTNGAHEYGLEPH